MKIVGITGPSGSGKSKLAAALAARGYLHADADALYHDLLRTSAPMRAELVAAFGDDILKDGQIDRRALAAKVFGKKSKKPLLRLNKITHKYVCRACIKEIRAAVDAGAKGILLDAPLLIEARLDRLCDLVVCVTAHRRAGRHFRAGRAPAHPCAAGRRLLPQKMRLYTLQRRRPCENRSRRARN